MNCLAERSAQVPAAMPPASLASCGAWRLTPDSYAAPKAEFPGGTPAEWDAAGHSHSYRVV